MGVARIFQRGRGSHWVIQRVLTRLSPEYFRLFAYKKAYKGGVTGTPGPSLGYALAVAPKRTWAWGPFLFMVLFQWNDL